MEEDPGTGLELVLVITDSFLKDNKAYLIFLNALASLEIMNIMTPTEENLYRQCLEEVKMLLLDHFNLENTTKTTRILDYQTRV